MFFLKLILIFKTVQTALRQKMVGNHVKSSLVDLKIKERTMIHTSNTIGRKETRDNFKELKTRYEARKFFGREK